MASVSHTPTFVHKFVGRGDLYGFTIDERGHNLPADCGPWTFVQTVRLAPDDPPRIRLSSKEVLDAVHKHGLFVVHLPSA